MSWFKSKNEWVVLTEESPVYDIKITEYHGRKVIPGTRAKITQSGTQYGIITSIKYHINGSVRASIIMSVDSKLKKGKTKEVYYTNDKDPKEFPMHPDKWSYTMDVPRKAVKPNTWHYLTPVPAGFSLKSFIVKLIKKRRKGNDTTMEA